MMSFPRFSSLRTALGIFLVSLALTCFLRAQEADTASHFIFEDAYFREETDQDWIIHIYGKTASYSGIYLILHDAEGNLIAERHVPKGDYSEAPFEIPIPKDSKTGDYRLVLLAGNQDYDSLRLPLSNLATEVYGNNVFMKYDKPEVWFKAQPDVPEFVFRTHMGTLKILDGESPVGETVFPEVDQKVKIAELKISLEPGKVYGIKRIDSYHIVVKPGIYLGLNPDTVFVPDARLREVAWWRIPGL